MGYKILEVEGIGPSHAGKLESAGVRTTDDLLDRARTPTGRRNLAQQTKLSEKLVLRWANLADLMRINGIGPHYSELLEAAGVDTVKELKHRNAVNLTETLRAVNEREKLARTTPSEAAVRDWIETARSMDAIIDY